MTEPSLSPQEMTRLLAAWGEGDRSALEKLAPLVYEELRRLAHRHMRRERPDHTLQTTALVNEAYLRLMGGSPDTVTREWRRARAWLHREIRKG